MENGYYIIDNIRVEIPFDQKVFHLANADSTCLSVLKCPYSLEVLMIDLAGNDTAKAVPIQFELNRNLKRLSLINCAVRTLEFNENLSFFYARQTSFEKVIVNHLALNDFGVCACTFKRFELNLFLKCLDFEWSTIEQYYFQGIDNSDALDDNSKDGASSFNLNDKIKRIKLNKKTEFFEYSSGQLEEVIINKELKTLNLNWNKIKEIKLNKNLEELDLSYNQIEKIKLNKNLEKLNLNDNQIREITLNENLEKLNLGRNQIKKITLNKKLKNLHLYNNQIEQITLTKNLEFVSLELNQIKKITLNKKLKNLRLYYNQIEQITLTKNLENVDLSYNQIKKITLNEKLKVLGLRSNQIEEIELNKDLEILNIMQNPLKKIKLNERIEKITLIYPKQGEIIFDNSVNNQEVVITCIVR